MDTAQSAIAWLDRIRSGWSTAATQAVEAALEDLIQELEPVTPVVSGRMQQGYTIGTGGPDEWFLLNTAESPQGYVYPARVVDDPHWSRAYAALNHVLETGEERIAAELDLSLTRLVQPF